MKSWPKLICKNTFGNGISLPKAPLNTAFTSYHVDMLWQWLHCVVRYHQTKWSVLLASVRLMWGFADQPCCCWSWQYCRILGGLLWGGQPHTRSNHSSCYSSQWTLHKPYFSSSCEGEGGRTTYRKSRKFHCWLIFVVGEKKIKFIHYNNLLHNTKNGN